MPTGRLVMFHRRSRQGPPIVTMPKVNRDNRWTFFERGYIVRDPDYIATLAPRLPEGYYILNRDIYLTEDKVIPNETLIQLSYSVNGAPILYVARFEGNTIVFPTAGYKFAEQILDYLEPAGFRAPSPHQESHLH